MIGRLIRKLAKQHRCSNTSLRIYAEKVDGHQPQVIVEITDKCTGATYEAAYTLSTAERVGATFTDAVREAAEMGA